MVLYSCYIFDRLSNCIYYKEWLHGLSPEKRKKVKSPTDIESDQKLMYGFIFSLRVLVTGIAPKPSETFHSFKTSGYKMHFYESPTGFKFVLLTDPNVPSILEVMKSIYRDIFVKYVSKNPLYKPCQGEVIKCHLFEENLEKFVSKYNWYN